MSKRQIEVVVLDQKNAEINSIKHLTKKKKMRDLYIKISLIFLRSLGNIEKEKKKKKKKRFSNK
jgi:hypothetical protein